MSAADQSKVINNANVEAAGFRAEADRLRALASELESGSRAAASTTPTSHRPGE